MMYYTYNHTINRKVYAYTVHGVFFPVTVTDMSNFIYPTSVGLRLSARKIVLRAKTGNTF